MKRVLQAITFDSTMNGSSGERTFMVKPHAYTLGSTMNENRGARAFRAEVFKTAEKLNGMTLFAIFLACFLLPMLSLTGCGRDSIAPEEIEVVRLYHYNYDGREGLFLLTKAPNYTTGGSCTYQYGKQKISLKYAHHPFGKKLESSSGIGYVFQYDLQGQTKLLINGKEIWNAEDSTATAEIPAYVSELLKRNRESEEEGEAKRVGVVYDAAEAQVSLHDTAGLLAAYDLDGNLISQRERSVPDDPYWNQ